LHAGSLVAALASWLDARAHQGQWLVRLEDTDRDRCVAGADRLILQQLADCGLRPDEAPVWQSERTVLYQLPLDALVQRGLAYPCGCSRKDIELVLASQGQDRPRHSELIYPRHLPPRPERQGRPRLAPAHRFTCTKSASSPRGYSGFSY
jgi:glutamyl-Q tRNA(Asp) synthetase